MSVKLYVTSVPSRAIFTKQNRVKHVLTTKGIEFVEVDLGKDSEAREEMRAKAGNPTALPPQIFNGDEYCGDFQDFDDALEDGKLKEFLKLT